MALFSKNFDMKKRLAKILFALLLTIYLFPLVVYGATTVKIENPLKWNSFAGLLNAIINFLFYLSIGIAPIMIIVAGFYFVTARGDPEDILTAKKIILWTLIGLLVVIGAKGLIALFGQIFGVPTPYIPTSSPTSI